MRARLTGVLFGITFAAATILTAAEAQMTLVHVGGATVQPPFTGSGDIVPFTGWYGMRAFSSATRGNKAVRVCNPGLATCADLSTSVSTGNLVITTIGGSDCSAVTCTITTWYDQSGNTNDVTNAGAEGTRPVFKTSCINALPCASFTNGSSQELQFTGALSGGAGSKSSWSAVAERTGNTAAFNYVISQGTGTNASMGFHSSANTVYCAAAAGNVSANDSVAHRMNCAYFPNTSVNFTVDGSNTAFGNITGNGGNNLGIGFNVTDTGYLTGFIGEVGLYYNATTNWSNANLLSLDSNQHTYWGI